MADSLTLKNRFLRLVGHYQISDGRVAGVSHMTKMDVDIFGATGLKKALSVELKERTAITF